MKPVERIHRGFIKWTSNWEYQHDKRKLYLLVIPFLRLLFNKPLSYDKELKKLKRSIRDVSQLNPEKWQKDKKKIYIK